MMNLEQPGYEVIPDCDTLNPKPSAEQSEPEVLKSGSALVPVEIVNPRLAYGSYSLTS